jgi:hypothetical protein
VNDPLFPDQDDDALFDEFDALDSSDPRGPPPPYPGRRGGWNTPKRTPVVDLESQKHVVIK